MFVKPAKGLIVRDPQSKYKPLPEEGKEVPRTAYWIRRLRDNDIELVEETKEQA